MRYHNDKDDTVLLARDIDGHEIIDIDSKTLKPRDTYMPAYCINYFTKEEAHEKATPGCRWTRITQLFLELPNWQAYIKA
jgi:hypothetical protein